jgi:hypothetical protein
VSRRRPPRRRTRRLFFQILKASSNPGHGGDVRRRKDRDPDTRIVARRDAQYQLQVNYAAAVFNQAGYQISGFSLFNFTTTF